MPHPLLQQLTYDFFKVLHILWRRESFRTFTINPYVSRFVFLVTRILENKNLINDVLNITSRHLNRKRLQ